MQIRRLWAILILATVSSSAAALQQPSYEQLQSLYDDSLKQLAQSQDRKNQLAGENERLKARVAELETELAQLQRSMPADNGFYLRHYRAWKLFIEQHPALLDRFIAFINQASPLRENAVQMLFDPDWPFSSALPGPTTRPIEP